MEKNLDLVVCEFSSLADERDSSSLTFSVELVLVLLLILQIFNLDFFSFVIEEKTYLGRRRRIGASSSPSLFFSSTSFSSFLKDLHFVR